MKQNRLVKNDIIRLTIENVCGNGNGVAHTDDGICVFVTGGAEGDVVDARIIKVAKSYLVAKIESIVTPSPSRIECDCPVGGKCGGCVFGHISYEYESAYKRNLIEDCIKRIGGLDVKLSAFHAAKSQKEYRNKAVYPVGTSGDGKLIFGFYAGNSHRIVEHSRCLIGKPQYTEVCKSVISFCEQNGISAYDELTGKGLIRSIYIRGAQNGKMLLTLVLNCTKLKNAQTETDFCEYITSRHDISSVCININTDNTNAVLSSQWRTLCGDGYLTETLCGKTFRISPAAFFQVNKEQTEVLYSEAARLADIKPGERVLDLYCGTGTIGICLANDGCKLTGVEISKEATVDASYNAKANGVDGEFICLDAGEALNSERVKSVHPDVVILDPPRKGCGIEAVRRICDLGMQRIVYISCDPATLARDLAEFSRLGFEVREAVGVDLFPRTGHVECCVLLCRT